MVLLMILKLLVIIMTLKLIGYPEFLSKATSTKLMVSHQSVALRQIPQVQRLQCSQCYRLLPSFVALYSIEGWNVAVPIRNQTMCWSGQVCHQSIFRLEYTASSVFVRSYATASRWDRTCQNATETIFSANQVRNVMEYHKERLSFGPRPYCSTVSLNPVNLQTLEEDCIHFERRSHCSLKQSFEPYIISTNELSGLWAPFIQMEEGGMPIDGSETLQYIQKRP